MNRIKMITVCTIAFALTITEASFAQSASDLGLSSTRLSKLGANDSILDDVYVKLYLARLRRAKLTIEREKQELSMIMKRRDRAELLYRQNVLTAEQLEETRKEVEIAAIRVQEASAMAEEAETFVDIAVSRISIGLEMPICAEIR